MLDGPLVDTSDNFGHRGTHPKLGRANHHLTDIITWSTWSPMVLRFYTTCKRKRVSKLHHSIHSPDGTKNGLGPENACVEALDTKRGAGGGMVAKI